MEPLNNPKQAEAEEFKAILKGMSDEELQAMISELKAQKDLLTNATENSRTQKAKLIIKISRVYSELNCYRRRFPNSPNANLYS